MVTVSARIQLLTTAEGGRHSAAASGYRPNLRFGELYTEVAITFQDRRELAPGEECVAKVTFAYPDYVRGYLNVGAEFEITEGGRRVGSGTIQRIEDAGA